MASKLANGGADDDLRRRRRRKVRGSSVVRQRSLTPDAREEKIATVATRGRQEKRVTVATRVSATTTSVKILHNEAQKYKKSQVSNPEVRKKDQDVEGLVDDGWGGFVQETGTKFLGKVSVEAEKSAEVNSEVVSVAKEHRVNNEAGGMNVVNLSEKVRAGDEVIREVRKRSVVEDRLEKLKLQGRLSGDRDSRSRRGSSQRRNKVRRRGRGRIVCLDWEKGRCTYGNTCKFRHEDDDGYNPIQTASRSPDNSFRSRGVCFDWQNGSCQRGTRCRFSHDNDQRERGPDMCFDFKKGRCHRGPTCKFSHEKGREDACFDFKNGRCFRGELCRFSHESGNNNNSFVERSRSRGVCFDWQKGICRRGYSCRFEHEEGSSQNNSHDGMEEERQSTRVWYEEDDEVDQMTKGDVPAEEVDHDDGWGESARREDQTHSAPVSIYKRKKRVQNGVDEYNSNGGGTFN